MPCGWSGKRRAAGGERREPRTVSLCHAQPHAGVHDGDVIVTAVRLQGGGRAGRLSGPGEERRPMRHKLAERASQAAVRRPP